MWRTSAIRCGVFLIALIVLTAAPGCLSNGTGWKSPLRGFTSSDKEKSKVRSVNSVDEWIEKDRPQ